MLLEELLVFEHIMGMYVMAKPLKMRTTVASAQTLVVSEISVRADKQLNKNLP
jgi:hypothetical protein